METAAQQPKRSTFLYVVCILTFIGSTLGIVNNLINFNNADIAAEVARELISEKKEEALEKVKTQGQKNFMESLFSGAGEFMDTVKLKQNYAFVILSNILTLIGAILMFNLRRTGFGFYILGIAVSVVAPFIIFGSDNLMSVISTMGSAFIGLIFIILYGMNLKQMR